jgi:hypothetical protein
MKWPSLRFRKPPPAQWTTHASKMMARMIRTIHAKNTTMPGIVYPATVLLLVATAAQLPGCG